MTHLVLTYFYPCRAQGQSPSWSVATRFLTPGLGGRRDDWIEASVFEARPDDAIRSYAENIGLNLSHVPTAMPWACSNAPSTTLSAELAAQPHRDHLARSGLCLRSHAQRLAGRLFDAVISKKRREGAASSRNTQPVGMCCPIERTNVLRVFLNSD
jgi:hypothetical protein